MCWAHCSPSLLTPYGGQAGGIPGVLTIKHLTTRKKKLVEGTKSQIKGNAKAKVIIQLRTGRIMSHKKWRTPDAPGQRSGGPGPQGMQRRRPQRLGGHGAQNHRSWGQQSRSSDPRVPQQAARVGHVIRSHRRSCPRSQQLGSLGAAK